MQDLARILKKIRGFIRKSIGIGPFKTVAAGETYNDNRFYVIQAVDGDLTYSATTSKGDNLSSGTVLQQGASITGTFEEISVDGSSGGSAIIYLM